MSVLLPGATIGIIGGGQLARMMAFEARRMGYRIAVLDPDAEGPACQIADVRVTGSFNNLDAALELARQSDVITLDTEHVPSEILEKLESIKPVRPTSKVMRIIQDRLEQRRFLQIQSIPQVSHAAVSSRENLHTEANKIGFPCILKVRRSGYDGKGQIRAKGADELDDAWKAIGENPAVIEKYVDFEKEISVLLARDTGGKICFYPVVENKHRRHILHSSFAPARIGPELAAQAEKLAARIASALEYTGIMAIEFFLTKDEKLLVNEIAPRPHNSGHYTFGACVTSQFEQHVRAICGLSLGDPALMRPAAMLNLLGDLWKQEKAPDWGLVLSEPTARLHLYEKKKAYPGRKMGHVLILGDDNQNAEKIAEAIAARLEAAQ